MSLYRYSFSPKRISKGLIGILKPLFHQGSILFQSFNLHQGFTQILQSKISILHSFSSLGKFFGRATDKYVHMDKISGKLLCLQKVHARLKGVLIENLDWTRCIEDFDSPETVFYVDPPYIDTPKIYDHTLSKSDHQRLLNMLFDCQGFVAVSGYPNEVYDSMPWDDRIEYEVFISTQTGAFNKENRQEKYKDIKKRQNVKEVLWIKE